MYVSNGLIWIHKLKWDHKNSTKHTINHIKNSYIVNRNQSVFPMNVTSAIASNNCTYKFINITLTKIF